jgi:hypothetical protein
MSTKIQQRFPWIRGILGSQGVSATTGQETKKGELFGVVTSIRSSRGYEGRCIREFVLRSRSLETGDQPEIQKKYSERSVIKKEFNM